MPSDTKSPQPRNYLKCPEDLTSEAYGNKGCRGSIKNVALKIKTFTVLEYVLTLVALFFYLSYFYTIRKRPEECRSNCFEAVVTIGDTLFPNIT